MKVLVIGETGVGKSTISNALVGDMFFESGPSDGGGLTTCKSSKIVNDVEFIDVPGYNDAKKENINIASDAVSKILKCEDSIVIVFVIELTPWRLKNTDACAISSFVEAIANLNDHSIQFGTVINKADDEFLDDWKEEPEGCKVFKSTLAQFGCSDFLVIEKRKGMGRKKNVMLPVDEANKIRQFVLALPSNKTGAAAKAVDFDNENKIREATEAVKRIKMTINAWSGNRRIKFHVTHEHEDASSSKLTQGKSKHEIISSQDLLLDVSYGLLEFSVAQKMTKCHFRISLLDFDQDGKFNLQLISAGTVICNNVKSYGTLSSISAFGRAVGGVLGGATIVGLAPTIMLGDKDEQNLWR
mmetsp:Transcript_7729/g.14035  ORF Transcript_7729/g.14035 Transcript_7729/m.14035 type:complete len:357 (-) Transcript_7729:1000-2070(-)|eukprot:CAMPEP_0182450736 /NCGR_PEP_ID=MMETSP1172-20130603/43339_1 /TAXON_ID=708627 /ORGANISM="Timspurckia oligopyrenoides, Strain CCMP3278" /LENGTH=356 /DNA_ID=CAMNT_0024648455 /DNA_START=216 /DNA_END=1286 /DNA_ORIENTATION=-